MDRNNKIDALEFQEASFEQESGDVTELDQLHLAMVGGGIADVIGV